MTNTVDSLIVAVYFLIVFAAGYFISRKTRGSSAEEFMTGGRTGPVIRPRSRFSPWVPIRRL